MFKRHHQRFSDKIERVFGPVAGSIFLFIVEVVQIIAISLLIIIPVRAYLIQPFVVRGASMEPSFYDREYLIIDKLSYSFREPVTGDIIVFQYPPNAPDDVEKQYFIKRVIGIPGEKVEVSNGEVTVTNSDNPIGTVLEELYLGVDKTIGKDRKELNPNEYYVLGDNRQSSLDSRSFGPITRGDIVGRVWFRGFPFNRISAFSIPEYNL